MNEIERAFEDWDCFTGRSIRDQITVDGVTFRLADRVRINPLVGSDIMDLALRGKTAIVEAIEQDYEDRIHIAVSVIDDPGRDLGALGKPAHRFFFKPSELEPLPHGMED